MNNVQAVIPDYDPEMALGDFLDALYEACEKSPDKVAGFQLRRAEPDGKGVHRKVHIAAGLEEVEA